MQEMKDAQFMPAQQKINCLKHWEKFLKNGLKREDFVAVLYDHLIQHCSFIAHFDKETFYSFYFGNGFDQIKKFLSQFDERGEHLSIEYGGAWIYGEEYSDINVEMVKIASKYIIEIEKKVDIEAFKHNIQIIRDTMKKYSITIEDITEAEEHKCCACGKPVGETNLPFNVNLCDCHCSHCGTKCFDDITLQDHQGLCITCFRTREEREEHGPFAD